MLDPDWVRRHADAFDVFHLHFGFDDLGPPQLGALVAALRAAGRPLVLTVHDLRNPHHADPAAHAAALDVLVPSADAVLTLTPGAAVEIAARWGRGAVVVPHPHVVAAGRAARPRPAHDGFVVGVHAKAGRANSDAPAVVRALAPVVAGIPGGRFEVVVRDDGPGREVAAALRGLPAVDVRPGPRLTDDELWDHLAGLDLSVLPYRFGTHSGWLEACHDLGTAVLAPDCGFYHQQARAWSTTGGPAVRTRRRWPRGCGRPTASAPERGPARGPGPPSGARSRPPTRPSTGRCWRDEGTGARARPAPPRGRPARPAGGAPGRGTRRHERGRGGRPHPRPVHRRAVRPGRRRGRRGVRGLGRDGTTAAGRDAARRPRGRSRPGPGRPPRPGVRARRGRRRRGGGVLGPRGREPGPRHGARGRGDPAAGGGAAAGGARPERAGRSTLSVLGFVYPGKGHAEAIEAAARSALHPVVVALGAVADGHAGLHRELRAVAAERGVDLLVTGSLTDADLAAAARAATVPLAPARRVGASGSLATWIGCGRRPVTAGGPYTAELAARHPDGLRLYGTDADLDAAVAAALVDPSRTRAEPDDGPDVGAAHAALYRRVLGC